MATHTSHDQAAKHDAPRELRVRVLVISKHPGAAWQRGML